MALSIGSHKLSEAVSLAIREGRAKSLRQYAPIIGFKNFTDLVKWINGDQKPTFLNRKKLQDDPGIPMDDWDVPLSNVAGGIVAADIPSVPSTASQGAA